MYGEEKDEFYKTPLHTRLAMMDVSDPIRGSTTNSNPVTREKTTPSNALE